MADKRDWLSPYNYVQNNPMRLVDPDGMLDNEVLLQTRNFQAWVGGSMNYEGNSFVAKEENRFGDDEDDPKRKMKKEKVSHGSDYDNWGKKFKTATNMFFAWLSGGMGTSNYIEFNNDEIAEAMRNSDGISKAREFFYEKYKKANSLKGASITDFRASFGLKQLFKAGFDPIEQFVGSFDVNIYYDEVSETLEYRIRNNTSLTSAAYHILPSYNTGGPMSNYYQRYTFSEKIDKTKLLNIKNVKNNLAPRTVYLLCMILFSCFGSEFEQKKITGRYFICTMDSYLNDINLSYQLESGDFVGVISSKVKSIGTNGKYIFVRKECAKKLPKEINSCYFIVRVLSNTLSPEEGVIGPMNQKEFSLQLRKLNIKQVVFFSASR